MIHPFWSKQKHPHLTKNLVLYSEFFKAVVIYISSCCLLLVADALVACYSWQNHLLFVAEIACCKKSLVTRCKICLLLVTHCRITRYSLQNSLVIRCRSCSLQKRLVIRCKIRSLLIVEVESSFTTLLKTDSSTGVSLWIFSKFLERLFCRTSANDCYWKKYQNVTKLCIAFV